MGTHPAPTLRATCPKPVLCLLRETAGSVEPGLPFPTSDFGELIFRSMNHIKTGTPHLSSPSYASVLRAKGNSSPTKNKRQQEGIVNCSLPWSGLGMVHPGTTDDSGEMKHFSLEWRKDLTHTTTQTGKKPKIFIKRGRRSATKPMKPMLHFNALYGKCIL